MRRLRNLLPLLLLPLLTGCTISYERHTTAQESEKSFKMISPFRDIQAIVGGTVEGIGKTIKP